MDPSFSDPHGSSDRDNVEEDRTGEEPTPSGPGDGRGRRSRRPTHIPLPINTSPEALRPHGYATWVTFLTPSGNLARFPNALVSQDWPHAAIPGGLSDSLGYGRLSLPPSRIRTFITPRGRIRSTQAAVVSFQLDSRPNQLIQVMLPILEDQPYRHFNVSLIVGRSLLRCLDGQEWLLSQNIPDRASLAALEGGGFYTFVEVFDYPRVGVGSSHMESQGATITVTVNQWMTNNVHIPE